MHKAMGVGFYPLAIVHVWEKGVAHPHAQLNKGGHCEPPLIPAPRWNFVVLFCLWSIAGFWIQNTRFVVKSCLCIRARLLHLLYSLPPRSESLRPSCTSTSWSRSIQRSLLEKIILFGLTSHPPWFHARHACIEALDQAGLLSYAVLDLK